MCKCVLCIPEFVAYFARLSNMERSFRVDTIYVPGPTCPDDANITMKLYVAYRATGNALLPSKSIPFMDYVRLHHIGAGQAKRRPVTGGGSNPGKTSTAVGVRFGYEMHDQYVLHFCAMLSPHYQRETSISNEFSLNITMCFLRCLRYLMALPPGDTDDTMYGETMPNTVHRYLSLKSAFPQPLPTLPISKRLHLITCAVACG